MEFEEKLFQYQEDKSCIKQTHRQETVVVLFITVVQRVSADHEGQPDHTNLEPEMMNDIDAKKREGAEKQGQQRTMDRAGQ